MPEIYATAHASHSKRASYFPHLSRKPQIYFRSKTPRFSEHQKNASGARKYQRKIVSSMTMDSPNPPNRGKKGFCYYFIRCSFTIILSLIVSSAFSFLCGILAVLIGNFFVPGPPSVATQCKIVSSSVDLRSSNVCELGLLNYNAKHVFYPLETRRFRCRHDYYWASVFEVEYKEDYLGQTLHAMAEAPKEALPLDCRPGFGTAWLTKHKFKVNETYNCRYTPGISEVEIYPDSLFNCKAKDPSMLEMMRRFFILFLKSMNSFFSNTSDTLRAKSMLQGAVAGVVSGVLVASVFVVLLKLLMDLKLRLARKWGARSLRIAIYAARFRQACIIVAYFSAMGWLAVQYGKMVGFSDLFISPHLGKKTAKR